jgi:hypothetical protein
MESVESIIESKKSFPCKISEKEAEILIKAFVFQKECINNQEDSRTIEYIYKYNRKDGVYILLEEFMFLEFEENIDITRAIGKNYYLNKR